MTTGEILLQWTNGQGTNFLYPKAKTVNQTELTGYSNNVVRDGTTQIKTTIRYHSEILESTRIVKVKRSRKNLQCSEMQETVEPSCSGVFVKYLSYFKNSSTAVAYYSCVIKQAFDLS